jgi:hypothetical protein
MTNISTLGDSIRDFLVARVRVDYWGLENPSEIYSQYPTTPPAPANSAIALPVQNVLHSKEGTNLVKTTARFPFRIAYRFPGEMAYHDLPLKSLGGMLAYIQILSVLESPDPNITQFIPVELEDSITVARTGDINANGADWLVYLNFAFDVTFSTTTVPDISELQPNTFYDIGDPPPIHELNIRINRAKQKFNPVNNSTYTLDAEIRINT